MSNTASWRRWLLPALTAAAFAVLTTIIVVQGRLAPLDGWVIDRFTPVPRGGAVHALVTALSFTASAGVGVAALLALGLLLSWRRSEMRPFATTSLAVLLLVSAVFVGKWSVGRARPLVVIPVDPEPAFPSGHTTTAVVVAGCVLLLLASGWSATRRRITFAVLVCYAVTIGVCRLYLGVHWFSDVLAGWLLGVTIVGVVAAVMRRPAPRVHHVDVALPDAHLGVRSV